MPGLFGNLTAAARALEAQRTGLEVAGQNIANVNTTGYARRTAIFSEVPPTERLSSGGGVDVTSITSARDQILERRLRNELPSEQRDGSIADALATVEVGLGSIGASLDSSLSKFFDSFATLAQDPTSSAFRQRVVSEAQALTASFREIGSSFVESQRDADAQVKDAVNKVNQLSSQVADLNLAITNAGTSSEALPLKDQLTEALKSLSGLLDITTTARGDGGFDVTIGNGRPLAVGRTSFAISATPASPSGFVDLSLEGTSITGEITSGRLGGLLAVRDTLLPSYITKLDTLAYTVVQQVNAVHTAGYDLAGVAAGNFFTPLGTSIGAAASIGVATAVAGDPSLIGAATVTGAPGDNRNARALANLRDARVLNGNTETLSDAWARLVFQVGLDAQSADAGRRAQGDIIRQLEHMRDSISAISLDEEAMMMIKFQRAYEANAKYFQTIDLALDNLLNLVRT